MRAMNRSFSSLIIVTKSCSFEAKAKLNINHQPLHHNHVVSSQLADAEKQYVTFSFRDKRVKPL